MVLHPDGEHLVAVCQGLVTLAHLPTWTVLKSVWIPLPPGPQRDLVEYVAAKGIGEKMMGSIEGHLPKGQIDAHRARVRRHFLPKQSAFSLSLGSAGTYLFCGTSEGLCVLSWDKLLAAADMEAVDPQAFIPAEAQTDEDGTPRSQLIYAAPVDSAAKRVLFAGLEGKVKFVNFADGRIGDLLSPPVPQPYWQLELTSDRAALVGTAVGQPQGRNKRDAARFQIWNYKALCAAAKLDSPGKA
jgi:hypothetical protein